MSSSVMSTPVMNNSVMGKVLELENITKTYRQGTAELFILSQASLTIRKGEMVALVGPSGSGKTTLLQIAGLLDKADSGRVAVCGQDTAPLADDALTNLRNTFLGFVYQFHHLLPEFSAIENVMIPQMIAGAAKKAARMHAESLLEKMGLAGRTLHRPSELSGGEQQRVAIARALALNPALLLADEPTGNLDPHTAENVLDILMTAVRDRGLSALVVTHNLELAAKMDRQVTIMDGQITEV